MSDELTRNKNMIIDSAQDLADDYLLGDTRYTEVILWEDKDFKVDVIHGFDCPKEECHHGERVTYKDSDGEFRYEILVWDKSQSFEIIQSKSLDVPWEKE